MSLKVLVANKKFLRSLMVLKETGADPCPF
jgi:hypothetical protein